MIRRYLILLALSVPTLSGCSFIASQPQSPDMIRAETLLQSGKNKEAAAIYKQLAAVQSGQQNQYRLLAADALIRGNDVKQAQKYLNMLEVSTLDDEQLNHLNLLQAQIELSQGNIEVALIKLKTVHTDALNNQNKIAYYQSLAFAYSLTGDAMQSAQALMSIEPLLSTPQLRGKNYEQILSTLNVMSEEALHLKQPLSNSTLSGWMALTRVFKLDEANLSDNLAKWRKAYPVHPANSAFLTDYVANYQNNLAKAPMIAVFLPESGAYAAPAKVIKKGFMKAYQLAKKNGGTNGEIHFYDTEQEEVAKLYQQAIKDGAKLVVGPLDKKDIKALVNSSPNLTIPVLALNHVEGLAAPKLYQFALSPIDDANQITEKAHQEGYKNAVFLVPKTEQGKRFSGYLTENWQKLGGNTVNVQSYDDSKTDFSETVSSVVKKNADDAVDAIIMNVYAKPARSLYPQLHKNKGTAQLPVYATSQIYIGDADAARDKSLNGVTFCDVPWVFPQAYQGELSKSALQSSWTDLAPSYLRLLPMGIDAYQLIEHLGHLKNQPYNGATGKLKLDGDNRITRELFCAKFVSGMPKEQDAASETPAAEAETGTTSTKKTKAPLPDLPELDKL